MNNQVAHTARFDIHDHALERSDPWSSLFADVEATKVCASASHMTGIDIMKL